MKRYIKFGLVLLGFALAGSCEDYIGPVVDCDDCYWEKPDSEFLVLNLTINELHPEVPIVLYRGDVEDGQVDWVDTARESPFQVYSAVNQYYSVSAEYKLDGKTIKSIDGDDMKAKFVSESCEYSCWIITGGYMELELKFNPD